MRRFQRFVFIEERINDPWTHEKEEENNDQRDCPELRPPMPRTAPNQPKQNRTKYQRATNRKQFFLDPIRQPRTPSLHGLLVTQRKRMPVHENRQLKDLRRKYENRNEDQPLQKTVLGCHFGKIPNLRGHSEPQKQPCDDQPESDPYEIQRVARARIGNRLLIPIV